MYIKRNLFIAFGVSSTKPKLDIEIDYLIFFVPIIFHFVIRAKSLRVSPKKRKPTDLTRHGGKAMRNYGSKRNVSVFSAFFF
jgi:hypothetical protein